MNEPTHPSGDGDVSDLYGRIRPLWARRVAFGLIGFLAVATVIFLLVAPVALADDVWGPADQVLTALLMVLICFAVWRQGDVHIEATEAGVDVRNFVRTHHLTWAQLVAVRFGPDHPWARLDLADGTALAAMGIQTSDGDYGRRQARRLATLIALHEPREG